MLGGQCGRQQLFNGRRNDDSASSRGQDDNEVRGLLLLGGQCKEQQPNYDLVRREGRVLEDLLLLGGQCGGQQPLSDLHGHRVIRRDDKNLADLLLLGGQCAKGSCC